MRTRFTLASLFALLTAVALFVAWFAHERKPAVGEFLYWDVTEGLMEYRVEAGRCGIHQEPPGAFFLTFVCQSSPVAESDIKPYLEVSLLFSKNPRSEISPGRIFPVVLYDQTYHNLQSICYDSVWEDFENATVTINTVTKEYIDATLTGLDGAGANSRVSVRARFMKSPISRTFS